MSYQQDPYTPQDVYAQQQFAQTNPNAQPGAYPPSQQPYMQPGTYPPPQQPYPYMQPEVYATPQQPYTQPGAYPPYQQSYAQMGAKVSNVRANRSLYYGIISLVLSLVTFFSLVGFAGIITGTFAIVNGVMALKQAQSLPGNPGRVQAIAAIAMGALAWVLVLLSFARRAITGS